MMVMLFMMKRVETVGGRVVLEVVTVDGGDSDGGRVESV